MRRTEAVPLEEAVNALRIETEDGVIIAEPPDSDGDVAMYGPSTFYLNADARRELIGWLAEHTPNPPCTLGCR